MQILGTYTRPLAVHDHCNSHPIERSPRSSCASASAAYFGTSAYLGRTFSMEPQTSAGATLASTLETTRGSEKGGGVMVSAERW